MFSEEEKREGEDPRRRERGKMDLLVSAVLQHILSLLFGKKSRAAEELERMSRAIRQAAKSLGGEDPIGVSRYAEQAAEHIGRASQYFRESDVEDLLRDLEQLVRRKPALAFGGALAAGFLLARFLKTPTAPRQKASRVL